MNNFIFYDFEVFKEDWGVVFKPLGGEHITIVNDREALQEFYDNNKDNVFVGFNSKFYDKWIFKGALRGQNLYKLSKDMIEQRIPGWNLTGRSFFSLIDLDVKDELPLGVSLKEIEANIGWDIEETPIDFDIQRKLTNEEMDLVMKYCRHDVDATEATFKAREGWVEAKLNMISEFDLDIKHISKTSAGLSALALKSNPKRKSYATEYYEKPKEIIINRYTEALSFFENMDLASKATKKTLNIAGVPHVIATGGIHGAREKMFAQSDKQGDVYMIDADAFYVNMMIIFEYVSRNISDPNLYKHMRDMRTELKKVDNPIEKVYKIINVATYGAMNQKGNLLYDPNNRMRVCITGQLLLIDIIEKIEDYCMMLQSNTDGILVKIPHKNIDKVKEACNEFEKRTGIILEWDKVNYIWQKDVNNYVMEYMKHDKPKLKVKGAFVKQYDHKDKFIKNNASIIDRAVVNFLAHSIPVEETINNEFEFDSFQIIAKSGSTFNGTIHKVDGKDIEVQKVNRVYATKDIKYGRLFKLKGDSENKIPNLPDHCKIINGNVSDLIGYKGFEDIDLNYYINEAYLRIRQYVRLPHFNKIVQAVKESYDKR